MLTQSADREIMKCGPVFYARDRSGELFRSASLECTFARGQGLPGQAWATPLGFMDVGLRRRGRCAACQGRQQTRRESDRIFGEIAAALVAGVTGSLRHIAAETALKRSELLLKLGQRVSPRTIRRYLPKLPAGPPGRPRGDQRWSTFLRNHARSIVACDFFVAVTARFRFLYAVALEALWNGNPLAATCIRSD